MLDVTIDGITYRPVSDPMPLVGIAVTTTLERKDAYELCLKNIQNHRPKNSRLVLVIDGADNEENRRIAESITMPGRGDSIVFLNGPQKMGIPAAKNASLANLKDCDYKFLFDDDAWPVKDGWEIPYIASGENHLSYQFADVSGDRKLGDMRQVYNDGQVTGYTGQRGVMLFYTKEAIDTVGGFDPAYGVGMYEHVDLAMRIYAAGLSLTPFGDVVGSGDLFYSLDENQQVKRTIADNVRQELNRKNADIYTSRVRTFRETGVYPVGYIDYGSESKERRRVYITTIITGDADPQRPGAKFDASGVSAWYDSISKNDPDADIIILTDNPHFSGGGKLSGHSLLSRNTMAGNCSLYFQRWGMINAYLKREGKKYSEVFITDGTDVVLLKKPEITAADSKTVFVGSEQATLASPWMVKNHQAEDTAKMITENQRDILLNAGIIGGSVEPVRAVISRICNVMHFRIHEAEFSGKAQPEQFDMGVFNMAVKDAAANGVNVSFGPHVNTVFKSFGIGCESAWFQHK